MKTNSRSIVAAFVAVLTGVVTLLVSTCATPSAYGQGTLYATVTQLDESQYNSLSPVWRGEKTVGGLTVSSSLGGQTSCSGDWALDYLSDFWITFTYDMVLRTVSVSRTDNFGHPGATFFTSTPILANEGCQFAIAVAYNGTGTGWVTANEVYINGIQQTGSVLANASNPFSSKLYDTGTNEVVTAAYHLGIFYDVTELDASMHSASAANPTVVPEPSAVALFLCGLTLLARRLRR